MRFWFGCVLGWITFALCVVLLIKFIGRVSKVKGFNSLLRTVHKPLGLTVIATGAIHGIFLIVKRPHALADNITGAILLAVIVLLAISYLLRKKLKAKWFLMHRILSVLFIVLVIVHIVIVYVPGLGCHGGC